MAYAYWKRFCDVVIAVTLLALTIPIWMVAAVALLIAQGPPLFFRQRRIGLHGKPFALIKFRTMVDGDPPRLPGLPVAKSPRDTRVTPLGRLLRRLKIDELPQFLNVLRGEMSLVGPRPLPEDDLTHAGWLQSVDESERTRRREWMDRRHEVLPGLTGCWQITPNPEADFENWIRCDLAYVAHHSLLGDLLILLRTPYAVMRGRRKTAPHTAMPAPYRQSHEDTV